MTSLIIKVLLSDKEIIYRDIQMNSDANLVELHKAILDAFGFSGEQMANFTKFDDDLSIASEYHLEKLDEDSNLMLDFKVKDVLAKVGDLLDYTYDFLHQWEFSLEVLDQKESIEENYILIRSFGVAPKESARASEEEDPEEFLRSALLDKMMEEEEEEDWMNNDQFDSLDDYEEYQ